MMGMHYALAPLQIQQIAETGGSTLLVSALTANFSQAGAGFGAFLRLKDKEMKSVAGSASLSAVLGITEPVMYGVNLKYKRPFAFGMASSAVAAAFLSFFNARALAYAPPGLFTIITYEADSFVFIIIGALIAFCMAAVLTYLFGIPSAENTEKANSETFTSEEPVRTLVGGQIEISSPIKGKVIPLSQVPDGAFSSGEMGKGVGIEPAEGKVYAPFDGTVDMLFDTRHAIGLSSSDGVELLIHIGLDTVELNGQGFTAHVKTGDSIKKGQLLIEFDKDSIARKYSTVTPVLVTNFDQYSRIEGLSDMTADTDTAVIRIN